MIDEEPSATIVASSMQRAASSVEDILVPQKNLLATRHLNKEITSIGGPPDRNVIMPLNSMNSASLISLKNYNLYERGPTPVKMKGEESNSDPQSSERFVSPGSHLSRYSHAYILAKIYNRPRVSKTNNKLKTGETFVGTFLFTIFLQWFYRTHAIDNKSARSL